MANRILLFYIFSLPFMLIPFKHKIQIAEIIFLPLLSAFLIALWRGTLKLRKGIFEGAILCYLFVTILSLISSSNTCGWHGFKMILPLLYLITVYFVITSIIRNEKQFKEALWAWAIACGVVSVLGIMGYIAAGLGIDNPFVFFRRTYPYIGTFSRIISTMQTGEMLGNYLLTGLMAALAFWQWRNNSRIRGILILIITSAILCLFGSFSRALTGTLLAFILVFIILKSNRFFYMQIKIILALVFLIFLLASNFITVFRPLSADVNLKQEKGYQFSKKVKDAIDKDKTAYVFDFNVKYIYTDYFWLKKGAWLLSREHPFLGIGLRGFQSQIQRLINKGLLPHQIAAYGVPHSTIFGQLAQTGVLGLLALSVLFVVFIWKGFCGGINMAPVSRAAIILTAALAGLFINSLNVDIMNFRYLWCIMAIIAAGQRLERT